MIHTKLWQNEAFSKLSDKAKILYIGTITLADDEGRLKANSLLLRSQVFPLDTAITEAEVRKWLNEIMRAKLATYYKIDNQYFLQHPNWEKYQTLRKDRLKKSDIPTSDEEWQPNDNQVATKRRHKISKDKIREEKGTASIKWLEEIPPEELAGLYLKYQAERKEIQYKAEQLVLWCQKTGRVQKNYKAFLEIALGKDFGRRTPEQIRLKVIQTRVVDGRVVEEPIESAVALAKKMRLKY